MGFWLRTDEQVFKDPLDPENIEWIDDQLSYCDNECEHALPRTSFLPTRLVDLGEGESPRSRLILTKSFANEGSLAPVKYATLSYCWGPKNDADQQLKTTSLNLDLHFQEIPEENWTPVIADTFRVCRSLGIRYVWIDALCIIQGCVDDWNRESEMMGLVFYHSDLTICPLSSHSCLQGFLSPRSSRVKIDFQSAVKREICGVFILYDEHNDVEKPFDSLSSDLERSTWKNRGWTLQEDCLSRRFLYFGQSMLQ